MMRPHVAGDVAPCFSVLDFDQICSQVGQKTSTIGSGTILFDGDDPQTLERKAHTGFLSTNCRAMIMRCISLVPSPMHINGASR